MISCAQARDIRGIVLAGSAIASTATYAVNISCYASTQATPCGWRDGPRLRDAFGTRLAYLYAADGLSVDVLMIGEGLAEAWTRDA